MAWYHPNAVKRLTAQQLSAALVVCRDGLYLLEENNSPRAKVQRAELEAQLDVLEQEQNSRTLATTK